MSWRQMNGRRRTDVDGTMWIPNGPSSDISCYQPECGCTGPGPTGLTGPTGPTGQQGPQPAYYTLGYAFSTTLPVSPNFVTVVTSPPFSVTMSNYIYIDFNSTFSTTVIGNNAILNVWIALASSPNTSVAGLVPGQAIACSLGEHPIATSGILVPTSSDSYVVVVIARQNGTDVNAFIGSYNFSYLIF